MKRKMASYLRKAPRKLGKRQKIKRCYPIVVRSNATREFDSENWNALRSWSSAAEIVRHGNSRIRDFEDCETIQK